MLGMQFVVGRINPSIMHKLTQQGFSITSPLAHHGRRLLAFPPAASRNHRDSLRRRKHPVCHDSPKKCQSGYRVGTAHHSLASSYPSVLNSNEAQRGGASQPIGGA